MKTVKYFLPSWHAAEERPPHNGQYIVMTGLQNIRMAIWKDFCWFALGPPEVARRGPARPDCRQVLVRITGGERIPATLPLSSPSIWPHSDIFPLGQFGIHR